MLDEFKGKNLKKRKLKIYSHRINQYTILTKTNPENIIVLRFVRDRCDSYHHQVGSCKMGQDEMAVVDPRLSVYGVEGLRVADASVMPATVTGNIHTSVMAIGEKCADMVKQAHGL